MPVYFNSLETFIMKRLNMAPAPVFDIAGGFSFFAIDAAIRINLFDALAERSSTAESLAAVCNCDTRGLITLLDLLKSLGYVKEKNRIYSLTAMTRKWILASSENTFYRGFEYYAPAIAEIWPHLSSSLMNGNPHINFYEWLKDKPETAAVYQEYMISLAKMVIPEIVKKIELNGTEILDIGGSHGMYSIALCKKYPSINVTIIDTDYAMPLLEKNIKTAGLEQRISLVTGDLVNYNFGRRYDSALLFNVYHEHEEEYNKKLSSRISEILVPGGKLIVLESVKKKNIFPMLDYMERIYGLLFYHFLGGRNYSSSEISEWLTNSGFRKVNIKSLHRSGFSLINAWRE